MAVFELRGYAVFFEINHINARSVLRNARP